MYNESLHVPSNRGATHDDRSHVLRGLTVAPTDSWEIDLCTGLVCSLVVLPLWDKVKLLGRSLLVLKVHKEPAVCEVFFMPREEVHVTYRERMPKTLEWVELYSCDVEVAFWAELYQPKPGGRKGKNSYLTNELCGGFGSRYSLASKLDDAHCARMEKHLNGTTADSEELARQAALKREKQKAKKDRQKARKAEEKAEAKEDLARLKSREEQRLTAELKANRIPAPALHAVDWRNPTSLEQDSDSDSNHE